MNLVKQNFGSPFPFISDFWTDLFGKEIFNVPVKRNGSPAINIKESKAAFEIEVSAPGYVKEEFDVKLKDGVLLIFAEHEESEEVKENDGTFIHKEFNKTSFKRQFNLPNTVDEDNISATYEKGVLSITLPKRDMEEEEDLSRSINVK